MSEVAENWRRLRERVEAAARRSGRDPGEVRVIAASKTQTIERILEAAAAGATDFGENYVQEAADKILAVDAPVTWHFIGRLQRNKAAKAVALFDVIHTVDSAALGLAIARHAQARGTPARVLVEVNLAGENTKGGVAPLELEALVAALGNTPWLIVDGLMAIPPPVSDHDEAAVRAPLVALRRLLETLRAHAPNNAPLRHLSMGMSDDFQIAIEEGATMVRVGRAIFGERS